MREKELLKNLDNKKQTLTVKDLKEFISGYYSELYLDTVKI